MHLRRVIITVFLIITTINLNCQDRWVKNYLTNKDPFITDIVESYDKGFLLLGQYGPNYPSFNWLIKTDINGEVIWNITIGSSNSPTVLAELALTNQGECYLTGSTYFYGQNNADPFVMKLNTCGEKEWCRVFSEVDNNYSNTLVTTPDGGIAMILALMGTIPFEDRICIAKLDTYGNLQWKQCYNSQDEAMWSDISYDLTLAPDGGFLITGVCDYQDPITPTLLRPKPYYIKTDSLGNYEWETVVHKELSNKSGEAWSTVLSPDSNYYYSSISHYYNPNLGHAPALLKMDLQGNVVDIYDLTSANYYGKMTEAKFITDTTLMASAVWGSEFSGVPKAVIIDTTGNILYQANLLDNEWMALTEVTFDGKLLFFTNINENDNFDAYLFKFNQQLEGDTIYTQLFNYDSLCPDQIESDTIVQDDCGIIVGMEEIYEEDDPEEKGFLIYPNPARTSISISNETGLIIDEVTIYNQLGKRVLHKVGITDKIDVSMLGKGMYIIEFELKQFRIRKKLIIH